MKLYVTDSGSGEVVVFLHGMASSYHYWDSLRPHLVRSRRVMAVDLLGFGRSSKPRGAQYDLAAHVQAVHDTLQQHNVHGALTVVGHSMGALIALGYALQYPEAVKRLVLFGMSIFTSPEQARQAIINHSRARQLAYYGWTSKILCNTWCRFGRPITQYLAPLYLRRLPKVVARDSLLHTWESYHKSMQGVIEKQDVSSAMTILKLPIVLAYGDQENSILLNNAKHLNLPPTARLIIRPGSHNLPLEAPEWAAQLILGD
ncbi:alpha/beta hydrolase [Candidatus Saccharibacteria bacterium]|nr:alpha/beta hydrolase [Candidatus Saccharibacteria bacterium]